MPNLTWKSILAIVGTLSIVALIVSLPKLRSSRWEHTMVSSQRQVPIKTQEELDEELAIEKATAVDSSQFAQGLGIRYLKRVPTTKIALEAVFRQRRADASLMLPASKPLFLNRFVMEPPSADRTGQAMRLLGTRRAILSIGLEMLDTDVAQLPWMSRSTILDFIQGHFVSLQARILKDDTTGEWFLHHRPIAGVAQYGSVPMTHAFVSPILETVSDIRGLGIYRPQNSAEDTAFSTDQTAVWLFRSLWMIGSTPKTQYDYAFIRASGNDLEPSQFHVVLTTNNLNEWHSLVDSESSRAPVRSNDTSTLGTVHFIEYASDGLHPKASATRSVRIKASKDFKLQEIIEHLSQKGLGWRLGGTSQ